MENGECKGAEPLCRESEGVPQIQSLLFFCQEVGCGASWASIGDRLTVSVALTGPLGDPQGLVDSVVPAG